MGTNFYFCNETTIIQHIGKRSAAGDYCWDCGITLAAGGDTEVHQCNTRWLDECPICDTMPTKESLETGCAGRELGFNKSKPEKKTGVRSCASFTWAISPSHFKDLRVSKNIHIENEYGERIENFKDILKECPIMFFDSIGIEFS